MENHIIQISNKGHFRDTEWNMTIDLDDLTTSAGGKRKDGYSGVSIPLTRAKKLLKLILEYGTEEDFQKCDVALSKNNKLWKYWMEMRVKS